MGRTFIYTIAAFSILGTTLSQAQNKEISHFLPEGYALFEEYDGDLNDDGLEDRVLIVKDTKKENFIIDRDEDVDRNKRGIIVLFNREDHYELVVENLNCFSSENEDGGVYFPPELSIIIENNNLKIHYGHGRYGYWQYIFRFDRSDFRLIGYKSSENLGPVVLYKTSIDFLTLEKNISRNINQNSENEDEVFEETWYKIEGNDLLKLSEIRDFDKLDMTFSKNND